MLSTVSSRETEPGVDDTVGNSTDMFVSQQRMKATDRLIVCVHALTSERDPKVVVRGSSDDPLLTTHTVTV